MKKRSLLSLCFLVFLFLTSCTKEVLVDVPPQLEVEVIDLSDNPQANVLVSLYTSFDDWDKQVNALESKTTTADGIVLFEGLLIQKYFFYAKKGSLNNKFTVATHEMDLMDNLRLKVTTQIK